MEILDLEFDEDNLEHLASHGLTPRRVLQVLDGEEYVLLRNKRSGSGQLKLIGPDRGGQFWTVILAATDEPGVWRPVTGWQTTRGERTIYRKGRS